MDKLQQNISMHIFFYYFINKSFIIEYLIDFKYNNCNTIIYI